jgi:hypothetical protein
LQVYALKVAYNFGVDSMDVLLRDVEAHESIPRGHPNLNRLIGCFVDTMPDKVFERLPDDVRKIGA